MTEPTDFQKFKNTKIITDITERSEKKLKAEWIVEFANRVDQAINEGIPPHLAVEHCKAHFYAMSRTLKEVADSVTFGDYEMVEEVKAKMKIKEVHKVEGYSKGNSNRAARRRRK